MNRYLIYRTDFDNTIVRESLIDNPGANEASLFTNFVIPEIQPLYLWRVDGGDVVPNDDENVRAWLAEIAPPPNADDLVTYAQLTGATAGKMDKVPTADENNVAVFDSEGNVVDGGLTIPEITGLTTYTFTGSGGTQVFVDGNDVTVFSAPPTGTTVIWGEILGNIEDQTDLQLALDEKLDTTDFNLYTGSTDTRLSGIDDDIIFISGVTDGKLDITDFNTYTGLTETRLSDIEEITGVVLTGVTNLGTGTVLGGVDDRNVTLKSILGAGNVSISEDGSTITISGETGIQTVEWGDIQGNIQDQTDLINYVTGQTSNLQDQINDKLEISDFNTYTGLTETRLTGIEEDILELSGVTEVALTGATNGLIKDGRNVKLGGGLTEDTTISGLTNSLTINVNEVNLQSENGGITLTDSNGGDINIESDAGSILLKGNDGASATQVQINVSETGIVVTDNRATPTGIEYNADYSLTYTDRSLVDKAYVDAVASGLVPKDSVDLATTPTDGNIDLSTGGLLEIDGVQTTAGMRVLVKNQTNPIENGIYVVAAGEWLRAVDFDGAPQGEVSQGNLVPVTSGVTLHGTVWVVTSVNPIIVGDDPITFTLFLTPKEFVAGVGIDIDGNVISVDGTDLAGNSIVWTGNTFNVDITSGTLGTKLNEIDSEIGDIQDDITFISGVTDTKLDITDFNTYTGLTNTRLQDIEGDISDLQTDVSGLTETKLDSTVFESYTASTAVVGLKLHLVATGGTDVNQIAPVIVEWDEAVVEDMGYSFTGGTVEILEAGQYELSYNVTLKNSGGSASRSIGAYLIKDDGNGGDILSRTATGAVVTGTDNVGHLALSKVVYDFDGGDTFELIVFRVGGAGTVNSVGGSTTLLINRLS